MTRRTVSEKNEGGERLISRIVKREEPGTGRFRLVIADEDINYVAALHILLATEFKETASAHAFTQEELLEKQLHQIRPDILILSRQMFETLRAYPEEGEIYVLTEKPEDLRTELPNVRSIFKYMSPDAMLREILRSSKTGLSLAGSAKLSCKLIVFYSPKGGTGKTRLALAAAHCLNAAHGRALYMQAQWLQTFAYHMQKEIFLEGDFQGRDLTGEKENIYEEIKPQIQKEGFFYIPAFRASLTNLNIDFRIFENMALQARRAAEFDYVILDAGSGFDENTARLLYAADCAVITVNQGPDHFSALKRLAENIKDFDTDKYLIVCTDVKDKQANAFCSEEASFFKHEPAFIEHIENMDRTDTAQYAQAAGVRRVANLVS